jgi:hypothetical protein
LACPLWREHQNQSLHDGRQTRNETKKQVFRRKRLLKVEKSSFLHPFFCFGKKG